MLRPFVQTLAALVLSACNGAASPDAKNAAAKSPAGAGAGARGVLAAPAPTAANRSASCAFTSQKSLLAKTTLPAAQLGGIAAGLGDLERLSGDAAAKHTEIYQVLSTSGKVYGYELTKRYVKGGDEVRLDFNLADGVDEEANPEPYYALSTQAWLVRGGVLTLYVAESFRIAKATCAAAPVNIWVVTGAEGGAQMQLSLQTKDLLSDKPGTDSMSVDRKLMAAAVAANQVLDQDDIPAAAALAYFDPGVWNEQQSTVAVSPVTKTSASDPLTGQTVPFSNVTVTWAQDGKVLATQKCQTSSASTYRLCDTDRYVAERVPQDRWLGTDIVSGAASARSARATGFASADVNAADLVYEVESNAQLTFDNYAPYFKLTPRPGAGDGRRFAYTADDALPAPAAQLNEPLPNNAANAAAAPFLKETQYYDFSSPQVKALAAQAAQAAGASPTQGALIAALLTTVNNAIHYDFQALQKEDIAQEAASAVVTAKTGVCQHFSAVFVAMARANGMPARMIAGTGLFEDPATHQMFAGPHAWVEVLLDGRFWLPLDPQDPTSLSLANRGYFPVQVSLDYETPANQAMDPNALSTFQSVLDGLLLKRISAAGGAQLTDAERFVPGPPPRALGAHSHPRLPGRR